MRAYYNEIDPAAAHVLRALITDGVIAPGDVDTRSIKEVCPDDLDGYTQCHFFAGFGGWSIAARMAGWPDERPLWTGSCPCQPFSVAGKGAGTADVRHLWPDFHHLIRAARPACVVGEQVAGAAGYGWFDGVATDLAGEGYASRCVDIPACAVDAPHIRQRLYWCAVDDCTGERRGEGQPEPEFRGRWSTSAGAEGACLLGHSIGAGRQGYAGDGDSAPGRRFETGSTAAADVRDLYADADRGGCAGWSQAPERGELGRAASERYFVAQGNMGNASGEPATRHPGTIHPAQTAVDSARFKNGGDPERLFSTNGRNGSFWSDAEWLACHDGKARRAKSGLRLLVDGMPGRIDAWRLAGNGIVLPLAEEVIAALIDVLPEWRAAA